MRHKGSAFLAKMVFVFLGILAAGAAGFLGVRWYTRMHPVMEEVTTDGTAEPSSEPSPEPAGPPSPSPALGTVKFLSEACGFGIEIDGGGSVVPTNLDEDLTMPGYRLSFEFVDAEFADDCDGADAVHLTRVAKVGAVKLKSACVDARRAFANLVDVVGALDKACESDVDCVAYGDDPLDSCYQAKFTSGESFAPHKRRHDHLARIIAAECNPSRQPCEDDPREAICDEGTCQGR